VPPQYNQLREYAGTHYEYDERGNQIQRRHNYTHPSTPTRCKASPQGSAYAFEGTDEKRIYLQ
jgi:hypothetical protein